MRAIIAGIDSLYQYIQQVKADPASFRPQQCPHCEKRLPWCHGHYPRKADRENPPQSSLNPIWIYRFYCAGCRRTCSVLPECIPPNRWYLWVVQQAVLLLYLSGMSIRQISQDCLPSRWTISRWIRRLIEQFQRHAFHLKSRYSWLGHASNVKQFWRACLTKLSLSTAMMTLNECGAVIP